MSYQALYRKYRPSSFENVTGQTSTIKILQNSIINNKISHAYLFYGPRGTGKTSVAKIFSRAVNCLSTKNGVQCEECDNCLRSKEKECIDIIEIDAASNNGVDEIRDLKQKVSFVPSELKYKVYIIDEVHMLSTGAFNALLKTLEEPPEYIIFILATTELNKVPSTIISRCQTLEFRKLTENQIIDRLKYISKEEKIDISDDALSELAKCANGGLRDAIGLLEKVSSYQTGKIEIDDVRTVSGNISKSEIELFKQLLLNKNIKELINKINTYYNEGIDLSKIISDLIDILTNEILDGKISSNNSSIIYNLDSMLTNMNKSNNPRLILEVSLLNIINKGNNEEIVSVTPVKKEVNKSVENIIEKKEDETETPKEETKTEIAKTTNINKDKLKDLRVSNTLSRATRESLANFKNNWKNISDLAFDQEFGNVARMLSSDIVPAASSDEYLILKSKLNGVSESINTDIINVEKIIEKVFNNKYKVICVSESEWNNYIDMYKKDKNVFVYKEETINEEKKAKSLKEKAKELFED